MPEIALFLYLGIAVLFAFFLYIFRKKSLLKTVLIILFLYSLLSVLPVLFIGYIEHKNASFVLQTRLSASKENLKKRESSVKPSQAYV